MLLFGFLGGALDRDLRLVFVLVLVLFFLGLHHLEERIVEKLLLEVLLQVEQGHVQEIHRLIQARIDLELLFELDVLGETRLHAGCPAVACDEAKRDRSRAVSVGPR